MSMFLSRSTTNFPSGCTYVGGGGGGGGGRKVGKGGRLKLTAMVSSVEKLGRARNI